MGNEPQLPHQCEWLHERWTVIVVVPDLSSFAANIDPGIIPVRCWFLAKLGLAVADGRWPASKRRATHGSCCTPREQPKELLDRDAGSCDVLHVASEMWDDFCPARLGSQVDRLAIDKNAHFHAKSARSQQKGGRVASVLEMLRFQQDGRPPERLVIAQPNQRSGWRLGRLPQLPVYPPISSRTPPPMKLRMIVARMMAPRMRRTGDSVGRM